MNEYNSYVKKHNATFILVLVPSRIAVDEDMQKATVNSYYNVNGSFFDYDKPYRLLEEFARLENITVINLYPLFKKEFQQNRNMYLNGDNHLNDYGHELLAVEVFNMLLENGIVIKNGTIKNYRK